VRHGALFVAVVAVWGSAAGAGDRIAEGIGLTIYSETETRGQETVWRNGRYEPASTGYATVREWRKMQLEAGVARVSCADVAAHIRPETVHFTSITDPAGTFVVEQNFEYDLVSARKLLEKYVDREVTVLRDDANGATSSETVTLLSSAGGEFVVRRADPANPIEIFTGMPRMRLGSLPGGLITRPTLVWSLKAERPGEHLCAIAYETTGIRWKADYTAVMRRDDAALDLAGWVTISNESGKTYEDARIKLVAGDVRQRGTARSTGGVAGGGAGLMRTRENGFAEKSLFEHKLYTLGRPATLRDNSQKQLELFAPVAGVPARKLLVYCGASYESFWPSPCTDKDVALTSTKSVDVYVAFQNTAAAGLGIPLPAGAVRVFKEDPDDGALEFVGEDRVSHTSRGERALIRLGSAFDLAGERTRTDFKCDYHAHWIVESFEIKVRNHKAEAADVLVREALFRWVNWEITARSHEFEKQDSRLVHFPVTVPADGEVVVTYTVKYTW
jgi:hypothetical protein